MTLVLSSVGPLKEQNIRGPAIQKAALPLLQVSNNARRIVLTIHTEHAATETHCTTPAGAVPAIQEQSRLYIAWPMLCKYKCRNSTATRIIRHVSFALLVDRHSRVIVCSADSVTNTTRHQMHGFPRPSYLQQSKKNNSNLHD